jgi:hypothetical protein
MSATVQLPREPETWVHLEVIHSIQKRQMIYDKCRKTTAYLPEGFGNEALVSSSSEYDINVKECLNSFKLLRPMLFLPSTSLWGY